MVTIPAQFNGPDRSGNGGWVSGLIADQAAAAGASGPVTVTLRTPPPLDTPLSWEQDGATTLLLTHGGAVIGEAAPGVFARDVPACPSDDEAARGLAAYPGFRHHPFDRCFTCGTQRADGDGLRLFTGPTGVGARTAGPWAAHPSFAGVDDAVTTPVTWAVLDCPGGWAADFSIHTMVLGRMTGEVRRRPLAGEPLLAVGDLAGREGRKFSTSTALYTREGELLGRSEQTWILVDIAAFS